MKIFQVITVSEYGGAQSVVSNLSRELSKDNQVFIIYGGKGEAWKDLDPAITLLRYGKHRKEISWRDFFVWLRLLYYRFKYRPDIVHLHSSKMGVLGRLAFPKKKIVYTVHGFDSIRKAHRKFLFVERLLAGRTGCIVGVSDYDVEGMLEEHIKGKLARVYNGIPDYTKDTSLVLDKPLDEKLLSIRNRYKKVMMNISRISKQKNFELFVQIACQLPEYAFVWIGNDTEIPDLPENVFCLGSVSQAYRYLPFADLFVLTSNYEGFPMSIIEAFCFSKPVISSDVGGVSEIIDQGINGYALRNNADVFVEHIHLLLKNEDMNLQFAQNARFVYEGKLTVALMVEGYKRIYDGLRK
jgi:glycosyltransferase involved in cell wall biosynthesis